MNLLQLLDREGLLQYVKDDERRIFSSLTFASYEKTEHAYVLTRKTPKGETRYRVQLREKQGKCYGINGWPPMLYRVYSAETETWYGGWSEIPCMTRAEEAKYPKLPAWLGTILLRTVQSSWSYWKAVERKREVIHTA